MPANMTAEEIKFLPMTPEVPVSKDPMAAAGASTLKAEKEGAAVEGVEGVKEVSTFVSLRLTLEHRTSNWSLKSSGFSPK